jgi:cell fate regulator YaaT (PSP1 superfamily)
MSDNHISTEDNTNTFSTRGCQCKPDCNEENNQVYNKRHCKLSDNDWLGHIDFPSGVEQFDCVEVRFKNSRKEFFRLQGDFEIHIGDIVAVEASPGHDIGIVSLTGETARLQMKRKGANPASEEIRKLYRRARSGDIEKWVKSVDKEDKTMYRTKQITRDLSLEMKMNDVEYQGDGTKAVFYYTAEDRVDFRQLIKVLAEEFKIRIEMRQIGVRQEAARLGGIGSCGRELCCATWMSSFSSVTTNSARTQQLSLNPQKLAGQCSKLKCCLNYEQDTYVDALKGFPDNTIVLKTKKGEATHQKTDVFKKLMWYSYINEPTSIIGLPVKKVKHIIDMNGKNKLPEKLENFVVTEESKPELENVVWQDDLNRFDKKKRTKQ